MDQRFRSSVDHISFSELKPKRDNDHDVNILSDGRSFSQRTQQSMYPERKTLFDQLAENRELNQREFEERMKPKFKPLSDEEIQYFEEQEMKKMQQNRLVKLEDALQVESFKEKLATSVVTIEQQQQLEQQPAFALVAAPKLQTVHPAEVDLSHLVIKKKKKKKTMKKSEVGKKRTREEGQGTAKQKETPEDQISAPKPPVKSQPAQLLKEESPPIGTAKPQLKNTEQELQHKKKQKQKQPNVEEKNKQLTVEKNPLYSLLTTSYDSD